MKKENANGPEVLRNLPPCPPLPASDFQKAIASKSAQLVDNRSMLAFGGGHIAKAMNIGPRAELSIWAGWMLDPAQPIYLVLTKDSDLPEVLQQLIRVGYTKFGGYLVGGMDEWNNKSFRLETLPQMTVHEVNERTADVQVIDVRSPEEWEDGHVPGAKYLFLPELEKKASTLDKKKPVAVYCDSGYRASLGASLLKTYGFADVRNVPGSWKAWKAAGYEIDKPVEDKKASDTNR